MKTFKYQLISLCLLLFFAGCAKRNFYPDVDDPGLSRFTAYGYNIATSYINGKPYINPFRSRLRGNYLPSMIKIHTSSALDTLKITWLIEPQDNNTSNLPDHNFCLLIPVAKSFSKNDFLLMSGKRLLNGNSVEIQPFPGSSTGVLSGKANVYFARIATDSLNYTNYFSMSALFDGNIGDSILITKGRFDFRINAAALNF